LHVPACLRYQRLGDLRVRSQRTIRQGDCILQTPGIRHREIACSDDFEVLEIVSPASFATRVVEAPQPEAQAAE
jgi:uncharacterized protein YjlB